MAHNVGGHAGECGGHYAAGPDVSPGRAIYRWQRVFLSTLACAQARRLAAGRRTDHTHRSISSD